MSNAESSRGCTSRIGCDIMPFAATATAMLCLWHLLPLLGSLSLRRREYGAVTFHIARHAGPGVGVVAAAAAGF